MNAAEIWRSVDAGDLIILDVRSTHSYSQGHVPGAVSAPYTSTGWGGAVAQWVEENKARVCVFADNGVVASAAVKALADHAVTPDAVWDQGAEVWQQGGGPVVSIRQITVDDLHRELDRYVVLDVREPDEWRSGVIPGAQKIPLGQLPEHLSQLDRKKEYAVVCAHGNRSQTGASFLADHGLTAGSVVGGMALWLGAGHEVERA